MGSAQDTISEIGDYLANNEVSDNYKNRLELLCYKVLIEEMLPEIVRLPGEQAVFGEHVAHRLAQKVLAGETTIETIEENVKELL